MNHDTSADEMLRALEEAAPQQSDQAPAVDHAANIYELLREQFQKSQRQEAVNQEFNARLTEITALLRGSPRETVTAAGQGLTADSTVETTSTAPQDSEPPANVRRMTPPKTKEPDVFPGQRTKLAAFVGQVRLHVLQHVRYYDENPGQDVLYVVSLL